MSNHYDKIVEVERLMSRLGVTIYDLETIDHVRSLADDKPGYALGPPELVEQANAHVDHQDLAGDYEYVHSRQRDLIHDALEPWRRPDPDDDDIDDLPNRVDDQQTVVHQETPS